ncbi:MAG TPA: cupin domain-containing protein [Arachidicoccus sp.]|nr:cupin domain-containing protein [Arachidicoccus sp.]
MKRMNFITTILTVAMAPLISFSPFTRKRSERNGKGFKINNGEGRIHGHLNLKGVNENTIDIKISGTDTDGDLAIFEQLSLSQGKGTPLHIHNSQDEIFYVLEGEYFFKLGDKKYHLLAGDSIFLPRKIPHAWTQASKKGKMTVTLQPAGKLEDFFIALASMDHEPTKEEITKLFADNDMEIVGGPLKLD